MFRFRLAPGAARSMAGAPPAAPASPLKIAAGAGVVLLVAWWVIGALFGHGRRSDGLEPDMGPTVLATIRQFHLHTVTKQMKDVIHIDSEREPNDTAGAIPGVSGLVHWATHNQALVVAEGTVEAGIDLDKITDKDITQIKLPDGKIRLRVHLPPVTIYPPNVRVHAEDTKSGMFWSDQNLIPKAQAKASRLFLAAAEEDHIRETAQTNAIEQLQKLYKSLTRQDIEFTF